MKLFSNFHKCTVINITFILIIAVLNVFTLSSCTQRQKVSEESDSFEYKDQNFDSERLNLDEPNASSTDNSTNEIIEDKSGNSELNIRLSETANSRYYDEGYDAGYDDGEDDAVNGNGWMGQYDNSNSYKGKSRKEYEQGYDEGYEAGYDDNYESADE